MTSIRKHRPVTLENLLLAAAVRRERPSSAPKVAPVGRVIPAGSASGFRPLHYRTMDTGQAGADAKQLRGGAALLHDVLHEDLDGPVPGVPAYFPTPGLGSQSKDPVVAAEYIARMYATHAPGGTQNR